MAREIFFQDAYGNKRPRCRCGKVSFDKKSAQTKKNSLERRGNSEKLRIYPCPKSGKDGFWHLTSTNHWASYEDRNE